MTDDLAAFARLAFEQSRGAGHDDRFADVSDLHGQVDALARVDDDRDVLGDRRRESLQLGPHAVGADADVEELVVAFAVGDRGRHDSCIGVLECHRGARHAGAGRIGDGAKDGRGIELCQRDSRNEQAGQDERQDADRHHRTR
jgi:hypothetical protein